MRRTLVRTPLIKLVTVFLRAEWRYLAMLNYEIGPDVLAPLVPDGTELDLRAGRTFVSVVGFRFLETRIRGLSIPWHRNFDEINLRFYVRRLGPDGWRRGVVFIKEVVPRTAIAALARWLYNENYVARPMESVIDRANGRDAPRLEYRWRDGANRYRVEARCTGTCTPPAPTSHEAFIAEHYWGYTRQRNGSTMEYRVAHPPWSVWAADAHVEGDLGEFYGNEYGHVLAGPPHSAFVADGSRVEVHRGIRLAREGPMPEHDNL